MAHNLSWIDPEALRALVEETAYRPATSKPAPATRPPALAATPEVPVPRESGSPALAARMSPGGISSETDVPRPRSRAVSHSVTMASRPEPRASQSQSDQSQSDQSQSDPSQSEAAARDAGPRSLPPPPSYEVRPAPYSVAQDAKLERRIGELLRWSCETAAVDVAFLADADGLLVAERGGLPSVEDDAACAVMFASVHAPRAMSIEDSGYATLETGGRCMVVVWGSTHHGRVFLGLRGTSAPPSAVLNQFPHALREALR